MTDIKDIVDSVMDELRNTKPQPVTYWKMKGGRLIAICDMTNEHLINTIKMLRRQIDGSLHDDFCWDNIDAMQKELRKRGINYG